MSDLTVRGDRMPLDAAYHPDAAANGKSRRSQVASIVLTALLFYLFLSN